MLALLLSGTSLLVPVVPSRSGSAPRMCAAEDVKGRLREKLAPLDRGFSSTAEQRRQVNAILQELKQAGGSPEFAPIDGDWLLEYTDAPDILGLSGGPFATLRRIGQQIDASEKTIANVLEYTPSGWISSINSLVADDKIQQRVLLDYEVEGTKYNLKIKGTGFNFNRVAGVDLAAAPPLKLQGLLALPFGQFEVLYNDGSLRVIRTQQGYYSVNRRLAEADGWGPGAQ